MNFKNLILGYAIIALMFNCSSSSSDDLSNQNPDPDPMVKVTYDADIKNIIDNNCIQCHGNPPTQGAPSSFTTFTQVRNSVNSILTRINSTGASVMPPAGQMPLTTRELIQQWKDDGLLEN